MFHRISFYLLQYLPPCVWTTIVMTPYNTYFLTQPLSIIHHLCNFHELGDYIVKWYCGRNRKVFLHSVSSAVAEAAEDFPTCQRKKKKTF